MADLTDEVAALVADVSPQLPPVAASSLQRRVDRFDEPLRVAIAGRVKAGKSTLLNALVGRAVAATDAAECTKVVTWYRHGHARRAWLHRYGEEAKQVSPKGSDITDLDLGGTPIADIERLEVEVPTPHLQNLTLIDTPGTASISEQVSRRSHEFFTPSERESDADVVVYLLRHLQANDTDMLEAFTERQFFASSATSAIAVLSRADEIGGGRADGIEIARRAANKMRQDPKIRPFVQTVVPVAGLLGYTAATMTQADYSLLGLLAAEPLDVTDRLLVSADRFVAENHLLPVSAGDRADLLDRFGFFGVKFSIAVMRHKRVTTATDLANILRDESGVEELAFLLENQFIGRAKLLKAQAAIVVLEQLGNELSGRESRHLRREIDRLRANAHGLTELRLLEELRSGYEVQLTDDDREAAEHALGAYGVGPTARLRLSPTVSSRAILKNGTEEIDRWRLRLNEPGFRNSAPLAHGVIRSLEGLLDDVEKSGA